MRESVIATGAASVRGDEVGWSGSLRRDHQAPIEVEVAFTCPEPDAFRPTGRPWLLAFLPACMRIGDPVVVEGELDQTTIENLLEWQEAMAAWHPGVLRPVPIRAEGIAPEPPPPDGAGALVAFSGGIDSCFSVVQHQRPEPGTAHRRTRIATGAMVHGFDIPLHDQAAFDRAFERCRTILEALDVDAHRIRTDVRGIEAWFPVDWETVSHGIWLTSALACLEQWHAQTIVPSTFPYGAMLHPWASNPITDPLLGSGAHPVWHDGAAYDRVEKAERIAHVGVVEERVRVCWEGDRPDRNCGQCWKCVTTQSGFWLAGVERPRAFDRPARVADLGRVPYGDAYRQHVARGIRDRAWQAGRADLVAAIEPVIEPATPPSAT